MTEKRITRTIEITFEESVIGCHRTVMFTENGEEYEVELDIPSFYNNNNTFNYKDNGNEREITVIQDGIEFIVKVTQSTDRWVNKDDTGYSIHFEEGKDCVFYPSGKGFIIPKEILADQKFIVINPLLHVFNDGNKEESFIVVKKRSRGVSMSEKREETYEEEDDCDSEDEKYNLISLNVINIINETTLFESDKVKEFFGF